MTILMNSKSYDDYFTCPIVYSVKISKWFKSLHEKKFLLYYSDCNLKI